MNLQEINFEQAKLLKQAGFVEHTTKFFDKNGVLTGSLPINHNLHKDRFSCVTVALAVEWLRKEKNLHCWFQPEPEMGGTYDTDIFQYFVYNANSKYSITNKNPDIEQVQEVMLTDALKLTLFKES